MTRKLFHILLISAIAVIGFSCNDQMINPTAETCATADSTIFINNELFEKYVFEYDSNNQLMRINSDLGDDFRRVDNIEQGKLKSSKFLLESESLSEVVYSYHENGAIKQKISNGVFTNKDIFYPEINRTENFHDDGLEESVKEEKWNEVWETFFTYNSNKNLIKKLVNVDGFFREVSNYNYDDSQNLIEISSQGTGSRVWKTYFHYNSNNQLIAESKARSSAGPAGHGYVYDSTFYEPNEYGLKIKQYRTGEVFGVESPPPHFQKFEYDSENRLEKSLASYDDINYFTTETREYHPNGALKQKINYNKNGNKVWLENYDADSRPLQIGDNVYSYEQNEVCF